MSRFLSLPIGTRVDVRTRGQGTGSIYAVNCQLLSVVFDNGTTEDIPSDALTEPKGRVFPDSDRDTPAELEKRLAFAADVKAGKAKVRPTMARRDLDALVRSTGREPLPEDKHRFVVVNGHTFGLTLPHDKTRFVSIAERITRGSPYGPLDCSLRSLAGVHVRPATLDDFPLFRVDVFSYTDESAFVLPTR